MVPTLAGRIETRVFALGVVGSIWLLIISPFLPQDATVGQKYQATFLVLGMVIVLGIGWEFIYHGLQQFRWEKDWPALFGLLTAIPEGILVWVLLQTVIPNSVVKPNGTSYVIAFVTVWLVVWMFVNGPMRVPFIHWRFRGGRLF